MKVMLRSLLPALLIALTIAVANDGMLDFGVQIMNLKTGPTAATTVDTVIGNPHQLPFGVWWFQPGLTVLDFKDLDSSGVTVVFEIKNGKAGIWSPLCTLKTDVESVYVSKTYFINADADSTKALGAHFLDYIRPVYYFVDSTTDAVIYNQAKVLATLGIK